MDAATSEPNTSAQTDGAGGRSASRARFGALGALTVVLVAFFHTSLLGLNFGHHWDEWYLRDGMKQSVRDLIATPREYTYNGVYFDVGYALLVPRVLDHAPTIIYEIGEKPTRPLKVGTYPSIGVMQKELLTWLDSLPSLLQQRRAFMLLTGLAIALVFVALRLLRPERPWAAAAAAGFIGTSWQVAYHARFAAVDGVMATLVAAVVLSVVVMVRARTPVGALLAAVVGGACGGAALGCKMTGVFAVLPVLFAALLPTVPARGIAARFGLAVAAGMASVLAFFVTTPGAFLDPIKFVAAMLYERKNYYEAVPEFTYWSGERLGHLGLVARWLVLAVPSTIPALSFVLVLVCVLGASSLGRRAQIVAWSIGAFVIAWALFMTNGNQLIVRNWLVMAPLMALLFGMGTAQLADLTERVRFGKQLRWALAAAIVAMFSFNVWWLYEAARTIEETTKDSVLAEVKEWIADRPGDELVLSARSEPELRDKLPKGVKCGPFDAAKPPGKGREQHVVMHAEEHPWNLQRANRGWSEATFSSWEIDYDFYPSWRANHSADRIMIMTRANADEMKVDMKRYKLCKAK